jgi:hypothetical protein
MTTSHTSSNNMTANQLTKIEGQPTALDIANLQREIIEMAGNMSNPNSKQFGHVGMMMTDVEYQKFVKDSGYNGNATQWSAPKESGP